MVRGIAKLEAQQEEQRRQLSELKTFIQGEIQSVTASINATSAEIIRLDSLLRGHQDRPGLVSELEYLKRRATGQNRVIWLLVTVLSGVVGRMLYDKLTGS